MTLFLLYLIVASAILGFLLISEHTPRICRECGVPTRTVLLPVVAAVIWPVLFACGFVGSVWGALREYDKSLPGACEHP